VYLGGHSHTLEPSSAELDSVTNSHYDLLGSVVGRYKIFITRSVISVPFFFFFFILLLFKNVNSAV
jgi:hypothetical protein